jgi:hypothetical protein
MTDNHETAHHELVEKMTREMAAVLMQCDGDELADLDAVIALLSFALYSAFCVLCDDCRRKIRKQARQKIIAAIERAQQIADRDVKAGVVTKEHLN